MKKPVQLLLFAFFSLAFTLPASADVTLINRFEVPVSKSDEFFAAWQEVKEILVKKPGCLGGTFFRSQKSPTVWINVAIWASEEEYSAAVGDPQFRVFINKISALGVEGSPELFESVSVYSGQ
jgi:quinol monooxygenase YgiN